MFLDIIASVEKGPNPAHFTVATRPMEVHWNAHTSKEGRMHPFSCTIHSMLSVPPRSNSHSVLKLEIRF